MTVTADSATTRSGYQYDAFLSYSRAQSWPMFVDLYFRPILDHWLSSELGSDVRIFHDTRSIRVGTRWQQEIESALASSKVMVALLTKNYFESEWCRRELATMLGRADRLLGRGIESPIIFPVVLHDCIEATDLPDVIQSLQMLYIHDFADPFMQPQSSRREGLSQAMRPVCADIARAVLAVPDESFEWPLPDDRRYRKRLVPKPRPKGMPTLEGPDS